MTGKKITIDVVSDVVCPWCFLGRKRLEAALASLPDVEAEIRWRPFQLDPTLPRTARIARPICVRSSAPAPRLMTATVNSVRLVRNMASSSISMPLYVRRTRLTHIA
ncbi:DSBA oxidoreductase [Brucella abortus]|nr:DSBA oxidoreductase [Brucella abortus]